MLEGEIEVKSQVPNRARAVDFITTLLAAALMLGVPSAGRAQQVVAFVNGEPITTLDVEHRSKFMQLSTRKVPVHKEVVDSLIDEILEIKEAKRFGIDVPDAEVERAFGNVATRMSSDPQKLTQLLANSGTSADTLKRRLRAQIAWNSLVRGRYKASLEITDKDVEAQVKPAEKNEMGYEYIMRPVIFVLPRGSPDAAYEARKREADALRARFVNCNDGIPFARALKEVAVRDQISKFSADLPQQLRGILEGTELGHLTPPETTAEGVQMFALCAKRETKSDTPEMHEIRDKMFQERFGAKAKHYLEELRRAALIEYKMTEDK